MQRRLFPISAAVLGLALAAPAVAQQAPPYLVTSRVEFAPEDAEAFARQVAIVRDAAAEIHLDARFAWNVYRWDNTFYFVSQEETLANLEDPEAMGRAFQGTPVQDRVFGAFEKAGALQALSGSSSVWRPRPELGYVPANPAMAQGQQGGAYVIQQWPKGTSEQAFDESAKGLMAMLGEMDGPYPVIVLQNVVGDGGMEFVVLFDDLANFYGANSLEAGLRSSGMGDRWAQAEAAHRKLLSRTESRLLMYVPQLSYQPAGN